MATSSSHLDRLPPFPLLVVAWSLLGAANGAVVAFLEPSLLEEGLVVHIAQRLAQGERLYRDVVAFTGPFPMELLSLLFSWFGEELAVGRIAVVVLQAIGTGAAFALVFRDSRGPLAHAGAAVFAAAPVLLFPLFSLFFYTTVAFYLTPLAVYAAARALESRGWAATSGAIAACIALSKQSVGAPLALFLLGAIAFLAPSAERRARSFDFAAGGLVVAAVTIGAFALRGTLADLVTSLVVLPLSLTETFQMPFPNLWPLGVLDTDTLANLPMYLPKLYEFAYGLSAPGVFTILVTQVLYALPPITLILTALRRLLGRTSPEAMLHGVALAAWLLNLYPRADWGHVVFLLPLAGVQLCLVLDGARAASGPARGARWTTALAIVAASLCGVVWASTFLWDRAGPATFGPKVPLRPISELYRASAVPDLIRYLRDHTDPGDEIFVARQEPLLYFATETRNPTPYPGVVPARREAQQDVILRALANLRYVVMSDIDQPAMTYYSDELPRVQDYLERHFRIPRDFPLSGRSWITVAERGEDRGATLVDLARETQARAWIRTRHGREAPAQIDLRLAARWLRRPIPVPLGPGGGGLDFRVRVPEAAVFQADVGLSQTFSLRYRHRQPGGRFRVSIARTAGFEEIAAIEIDEAGPSLLTWSPVEADLRPYAGAAATLRLEVIPKQRVTDQSVIAWWGSPRLASPPGDRSTR